MKIYKKPTKKEAQELEDLVYKLYSEEKSANSTFGRIDEMLGEIIFGENKLASKHIYEEESENICEAEKNNYLISGLIMPYPRSFRENISQSKARFKSLFNVVSNVYASATKEKFDYQTDEYRMLRHMVFLRDGERCAKCGAKSAKNNWLEIDHIKPVSKYSDLTLDIDNLQVLCRNCNRLKSNIDETDYRRKGNGQN